MLQNMCIHNLFMILLWNKLIYLKLRQYICIFKVFYSLSYILNQ